MARIHNIVSFSTTSNKSRSNSKAHSLNSNTKETIDKCIAYITSWLSFKKFTDLVSINSREIKWFLFIHFTSALVSILSSFYFHKVLILLLSSSLRMCWFIVLFIFILLKQSWKSLSLQWHGFIHFVEKIVVFFSQKTFGIVYFPTWFFFSLVPYSTKKCF